MDAKPTDTKHMDLDLELAVFAAPWLLNKCLLLSSGGIRHGQLSGLSHPLPQRSTLVALYGSPRFSRASYSFSGSIPAIPFKGQCLGRGQEAD